MTALAGLLLGLSVSHAQDGGWGGLRDTAGTLPAGAWAVRLPTGRTALGLRDGTEVFVQPVGLAFAGTRAGLEQELVDRGAWIWSVSPSAGVTWDGLEGSAELRSMLSRTAGAHRLNLSVAARGRIVRQAVLSSARSHTLSADRLLVPAALTHDWLLERSIWRSRLMVAAADEGEALTYGTLSTSWIRAFEHLHVEVGAGVLVGKPSEHVFLGHYTHRLVTAYPTIDLWWSI